MEPITDNFSISVAAARSEGQVTFALVIDQFAFDYDNLHSAIYDLEGVQATERIFHEFAVTALAWDGGGQTLIGVGQYGEAFIYEGSGGVQEQIHERESPIRDVSLLDGTAYACGANLLVYRRRGSDDWQEIGPGDELRANFPHNHLEAIAGYSANEIYAAGRDGVIWWYDGQTWTPIQCSTNLAFVCIDCAPDGYVYVGGLTGIVARGRRDEFTLFCPPSPLNDIWGIQYFDRQVYCAMSRALLVWSEETGFEQVPEAHALANTFYNLDRNGGTLWSLGEKDVLKFSGSSWTRIDRVEVA